MHPQEQICWKSCKEGSQDASLVWQEFLAKGTLDKKSKVLQGKQHMHIQRNEGRPASSCSWGAMLLSRSSHMAATAFWDGFLPRP